MTIEAWKDAAAADACRRGLDYLLPMIDTLGEAIRAVRSGDWNEAPWDPITLSGPEAAHRAVDVATSLDLARASAPDQPLRRVRPPALSVLTLADDLGAGRVSSREVIEACLGRIDRENGRLNAFITVTEDLARRQAAEADAAFARGDVRSPLQGVPVSLKDLIALEGVATTAASNVRRGVVAPRDALVVSRLRQAGAVIVGTCNLHEFAYGTTSEDSAFGPAHHPLDPAHSPGGSSGGSAAAVAVGLCAASVGTDTGGSIRIPAAACGTVGLKPAYGELPCDGVVPLARGLDHVGPITSTVSDAWLLYRVMRGKTLPAWPPTTSRPERQTLTLGVPRRYFLDQLDSAVRHEFEAAIERARKAGIGVTEVCVPHATQCAPVYLLIVFAEAAAYHGAGLETCPDKYTAPVRSRLELSRYVPAEDYVRAQAGRRVLREEVDQALAACDALILPTLPISAPRLGATSVEVGEGRMPVRAATLRLTQLFNLTGHPAVSIPAHPTADGWPTGVQLVGPLDGTEHLLDIARVVEPIAAE